MRVVKIIRSAPNCPRPQTTDIGWFAASLLSRMDLDKLPLGGPKKGELPEFALVANRDARPWLPQSRVHTQL